MTEFDSFLGNITSIVLAEASAPSSQDLAAILAYYMLWQQDFLRSKQTGVLSKHTLSFAAKIAFVFDRFYKIAVLSDVSGDCDTFMSVG